VNLNGTPSDPGQLKACHHGSLVTYPSALGNYPSWDSVPFLTPGVWSDGTSCASPLRNGLTLGERGLVVGDFNGDGFDDLAAGAPGEDVGSIADAGQVAVTYGAAAGLPATHKQNLVSGDSLGQAAEVGDLVGASLAVGDFDNDGYDDLAIGSPGEDSSVVNGGAVLLAYGSSAGLVKRSGQEGGRQGGLFAGADEANDYLGSSLTVGDFNGDGFDDLAVGAPGEDSGVVDGGAVYVTFGSNSGLDSATAIGGRQGGLFAGADEAGDRLGASVVSGDFNGDGFDDLAAGAPTEDSGIVDGGAVYVTPGSQNGLDTSKATGGRQGGLFAGADEASDYLGASLAVGDFDNDGYDDLAAGVPGEDSGVVDGGSVLTVMGSSSGLDSSRAGGGRQGGFFGQADEAGDYLGASVTTGDFDGDGYDDLAAGVPGEDGSVANGGAIVAVLGSAQGLDSSQQEGGRQGGLFAGTDEANDFLGASLAAGDFDHDGFADLASGATGEDSSLVDGGAVYATFGSSLGLDASRRAGGRQGGLFAGTDEAGDYLGGGVPTARFW
jgi:FG-GAP repeat